MVAFFVFVTAGFGYGALRGLGTALNFRGWRRKLVQRSGTQWPYTWMFRNAGPDSRGLDLWARIVAWSCFVIGTIGFVSGTIAIINGV